MKWHTKATSTLKSTSGIPRQNSGITRFTNGQMASIGAIFTSTYRNKQLNPCQTHQPVVWGSTAGCLLVKGRWNHLKRTQALLDVNKAPETSHSQSSLENFQYQYMAESLVNVYSYGLMVKSVFCYCVHGRWLFSNPVTFVESSGTTEMFIIQQYFFLYNYTIILYRHSLRGGQRRQPP